MAGLSLLELGARANAERERRHGNRAYFCLVPHAVHRVECAPDGVEAALAAVPPVCKAVAVIVRGGDDQTTGEAEIRAIALARLTLTGVDHIVADVTALGEYVAQVALRFGADQLAGFPSGVQKKEILRQIAAAGREAFECDAEYQPFQAADNALPVLHS